MPRAAYSASWRACQPLRRNAAMIRSRLRQIVQPATKPIARAIMKTELASGAITAAPLRSCSRWRRCWRLSDRRGSMRPRWSTRP